MLHEIYFCYSYRITFGEFDYICSVNLYRYIMDIKKVIKANGLTVKEVAERMGITREGLSNHINGNPSVQVLERIAAAIGCSVGDFFAPQPSNTINCPNCGSRLEADCGDLVDIGGKTSRFWCPVCRKERYVPWSALRKRVVYEDKSAE